MHKQRFGEAKNPFSMKGSPFQRNFGIGRKVLDRSAFRETDHFLEKDQTGPPYEKEKKKKLAGGSCPACDGKKKDCVCPEKYPLGMEDPEYRKKVYKKTEVERR